MICWIMHVPLCLQAIMGGRAVELSPDDYVYAAVQVRWATAGTCRNGHCRRLGHLHTGACNDSAHLWNIKC